MLGFINYAFSRVYSYPLAPLIAVILFAATVKLGAFFGGAESILLYPGVFLGGIVVLFFILATAFYWGSFWVFLGFLLLVLLDISIIYMVGSVILSWLWVPVNFLFSYWIYSAKR